MPDELDQLLRSGDLRQPDNTRKLYTIPVEPEPPENWGILDEPENFTSPNWGTVSETTIDKYPNGYHADESTADEWRDPWKPYTLADAYAPRPPIQYAAGKLFALPSLNIFYGAPGDLKSYFLADLAVCIAAGVPFLPEAPWQPGAAPLLTKQMPVMWIDFDNGRRTSHDRFESLARARKLPPDLPLFYFSMPTPGLNASDTVSLANLTRRLLHYKIGAFFIDNLKTISGGVDENTAAMGDVLANLRRVVEDTGAANVTIHHPRKGNGMGGGRAGDNLRGHSSIEGTLDLSLVIEREPFSDDVNILPTKVRGDAVQPFGATFTYVKDEHGKTIEAKFYGRKIDDNKSDAAIEQAIKVVLTGCTLNQAKLLIATKEIMSAASKNRTLAVIKRMEFAGKLQTIQGERGAILYAIP